MAVYLKRLQGIVAGMPPLPDIGDSSKTTWQYSQFLDQKNTDFFRPLAKNHLSLTIEYQTLCAQLNSELMVKGVRLGELTEQIACALMMAELLEYLYRYYLAVPREQRRYSQDQIIWRNLLRQNGFRFGRKKNISMQPDMLSQRIRNTTAKANWPRLFIVRSKRLMEALTPILKSVEGYAVFIRQMSDIITPALSYVAWLFYLPRLVDNTGLLIKHLAPLCWMHKKEQELGCPTRLYLYIQRHWFDVGNDSAWVAGGLLTCFVLTGTLAPAGMYLNIGLFAFDIALAGLRAYIELRRLYQLRREYADLEEESGATEDGCAIQGYLNHLQARIYYEQRRLTLSVVVTSALFVGMVLTVPSLAFNPIVPLIAASILVTVTLAAYLAFKYLEKQKPNDRIDTLASLCKPSKSLSDVGFFTSKSLPERDSKKAVKKGGTVNTSPSSSFESVSARF
ncbi:hypothetical protein [Legionella spiritensis]|uniref:hypothetical protein n=1 Tax=Legionella spiritensis TaxID=452 RepID=UPI000F6E75D4|nr:hypothetical protein [Legionella spiritensis]VEG91750.1 Uncharacterised protein [Legionella spiritensis]